jgi:hypothetical protein
MTQTIGTTNKGGIYEIAREATREAMRVCGISDGTRLYYIILGAITRANATSLAAQRESVHPWQAFLEARADAIDWLHADGKTDAEIAKTLSMDGPVQVYLIRTRHRPSAIRQQDKGEPG